MNSYGHVINIPCFGGHSPMDYEKEFYQLKKEFDLLQKEYLKDESCAGNSYVPNNDDYLFYKNAYEEDRNYIRELEFVNDLKDAYVWLDVIQRDLEDKCDIDGINAMGNRFLAVHMAKKLIREKITGIVE